ncbi:zinc finger protein castor homolog 1-like [Mercenaria mercenaria]|uniref:zinc finger protein castor homolog 1-like n=1 Tax=Mercenaria mercenaria TaxID=6596 RepID=UPI00234E97E1|nr:zinc finger protein castor homolog 1-like [Mercenaria mercenaria]XP_045161718.2 zinc finger protein castor homolog 1-like [Mercenaria mercenaria]XP_045161719.2 zinc finger protein castor homolog 1-like [Mercenaria mercenaria]XP_053379037.1 zinc finger protein castor homolog 1-like [Mercenaria mercenaria]
MALTSGRKLCKLDAICAKLKQISSKEQTKQDEEKAVINDRNNVARNREDIVEELPTDLSVKCANNNIIGKADLNTLDGDNVDSNGLDLSKRVKIDPPTENNHENGVKTVIVKKDYETDVANDAEDRSSDRCFKSAIADNSKGKPVMGSGRRKRAIPRSISQVRDFYDNVDSKDELAEYEINNQNTNFPPEDAYESERDTSGSGRESLSHSNDFGNEESNLSLSNNSKSLGHSGESLKLRYSSDFDSSNNILTPLDLSISRSKDDDDSINGYLSSDEDDNVDADDDDEDDFFHPDRNLVIDESKPTSQTSEHSLSNATSASQRYIGSEQAAHLKDYAESTMNELISMYGFGGVAGHHNDIAKQVPMKNFKTILQHSPQDQTSPGSTRSSVLTSFSNQPMSSGDEESHDGSTPMKGIYANYVNSTLGASSKVQGGVKTQNDRFTTSSSFINAVYNNSPGQTTPGQLSPGLPNYSKYLKRYNNGTECGGQHCNDLGYREHYHCIDCSFQVFVKKEEMVRHYKWHRKREESLQHGFLRFSPLDNCTKRFGNCTHNGKQTHYHCLQNGCDKVYISTSDVQMHANYHRKDSAIMSEGFQRFRATEDCGTMSCSFYGQRTTHFHCLRPDCKFTFKNKADMEKHKSYHQKDEVLGRDGFKKFMKYEHCMFQRCRYSKVSNHIHCIRSGCDYVLHSTAQLYSHKRKHERRDFENAYKKYRDNHQPSPQTANKLILPRTDFGTIQQLATLSGSPVIQTLTSVANMPSGLKRQIDWDHQEPMELTKKPKLEPGSDVDVSAPSTPSARSTPVEKISIKMETDDQSMDDESLHSVTDSPDVSPDIKSQLSQIYKDGKSLSLSGSLTLPIPMFSGKKEPNSAELPVPSASVNIPLKPASNLGKGESMFSASSSLGSAMPSTLGGSLVTMNPGALLTVPTTFHGPSTVLQPPKSVYTERREKDDSWKTYLVRYTANDPCNPRCQYLYKDHYHCKMDGCLVLFKSKDGVREHARFHELQDRITPIAYQTYEDDEECPDRCQYSEKEKHYHCIWTGCNHVVPYVGPTFGRLEHYRIHEYARAAAGKSYNRGSKSIPSIEDNSMRRRGRPPKYPKIELPKIPKVELTDEEIRQSHVQASDLNVTSQTKVINGFRIFSPDDPCPDERCNFIGKLHYHCARPRCFTITDRIDVLNLHAKDFHSFVKILEGYEFFDRNVSCRRIHCQNNQTNRHFHCTRQKCDYSFIRHSTMAQHEKKHQYSGGSSTTSVTQFSPKEVPISPKTFRDVPLSPLLPNTNLSPVLSQKAPQGGTATSVITSAAAFLQVKQTQNTGIPVFISQAGNITSLSQGPVIVSQQAIQNLSLSGTQVALKQTPANVATVPVPISTVQALPASVTSSQLVTGLPAPLVTVGGAPIAISPIDSTNNSNPSVPLTVLLQRGVNQIPQPSWNELRTKMHYAISQNCGRPFCKLKKKDHYHCFDCNQAFSDPARLRSHIGKHGVKIPRADQGSSVIKHASQVTSPQQQKIENHIENQEDSLDPDEAQCLAEGRDMVDSNSDVEDPKSSSLNLNPSTFSEMISKAQEQNKISTDAESDGDDGDNALHIDTSAELDYSGNQSDSNEQKGDVSIRSGRKIFKTKKDDFMNSGDINLSKQRQLSAPKSNSKQMSLKSPTTGGNKIIGTGTRGLRDDSIPDGYSRWRYNEECKYPKCAYRHSVTHFHCVRDDCGYGFSDRSRLVQHTLRHERIDSITGGELQQYRINQDCGAIECEYNKKMSHFHCKRCSYVCTDSSKVLTHRKYHAKMDNISNQGFEKHTAADDCGVSLCPYARKQNHFHCLIESCRAAALGPVQMTSHKAKHTSRDNL